MDGLLIINKPLHITSMDVIRKIRKLSGIRKVGHAGTLDPLASGVLLVCLGKATKNINSLMDTKKTYIAEIDLTAFSETDDAEGILTSVDIKEIPSKAKIDQVLKEFIGDIEQLPPKYSALKIGGKPAYELAREGKEVFILPRTVTIYNIELLNYNWPKLRIKVDCGKGTYIRSLARDIGKKLNTGGYLTELIRIKVGLYTLEQAINLESLDKIEQKDLIQI